MTEQQALARQLHALLGNSDADLGDIDEVYIQILGEQVVQMARQTYEREGRGIILIDMHGIDVRNTSEGGVPMYYISIERVRQEGLIWPAVNIEQEIIAYDPDNECVIVIDRESGPRIYIATLG